MHLENEKKKMYEEMKKEINKLEEEITDLGNVNRELLDYIETLEQKESLKCQRKNKNKRGGNFVI